MLLESLCDKAFCPQEEGCLKVNSCVSQTKCSQPYHTLETVLSKMDEFAYLFHTLVIL